MKLFKDWTLFEKILLFNCVIINTTLGIVFKSQLITILSPIIGNITVLLLAKGKKYGQPLGGISTILYSIVSYKNRYYGEMLINICVMLPIFILGTITWFTHNNKKTNSVEINTISSKEWTIVSLLLIVIFIGVYFLLKAFNTNELFVSTMSVTSCLFANYLQMRRSKYSFGFYLVDDVILTILWLSPIIHGNLLFMPMMISTTINFISDLYGFINWKRTEIIQRS